MLLFDLLLKMVDIVVVDENELVMVRGNVTLTISNGRDYK